MQAKEAFDALAAMAGEELQKVQQAGSESFASGDLDQVHEAAARLQRIKALIGQLNCAQQDWAELFPTPPEPIQSRRTPDGEQTHQSRYWLPLLQALVEMGGSGKTARVIDRVGELMADILNDRDLEELDSGRDIRWCNITAWARNELVEIGYLRNDSPRGIWEITSEGREYLEKNRK